MVRTPNHPSHNLIPIPVPISRYGIISSCVTLPDYLPNRVPISALALTVLAAAVSDRFKKFSGEKETGEGQGLERDTG